MNEKVFNKLPKVELHLHLDCCMSFEVVSELQPEIFFKQYQSEFIAPPKCKNLADFLDKIPRGLELMQSIKQLELVIDDLFNQLKKDNVIYAEIRFAPLLHINNGLKAAQVIETVIEAFNQNIKRTEIQTGIILCTLRHFTEKQSLQTAELTRKYFQHNVLKGFDIAADESGFPLDNHIEAFKLINKNHIPATAHAGEAKGAESVWETLEKLKPLRIGHGIRSIEDENLVDNLIKHNIFLEVCPTCNIQVDVFDKYNNHPIDQLLKAGVPVGINTDARTTCNITLSKEYEKLNQNFGWGIEEFEKCNLNAISHAFISKHEKEILISKLKKEYQVYK